jgi:hypothetical protein
MIGRLAAVAAVVVFVGMGLVLWASSSAVGEAVLGGVLPGSPPGTLFPADNWWSTDVTYAPVDAGSAAYIQFINNCASCCPGGGRGLHPDFGGNVSAGSVETYGVPYVTVGGDQPRKSVIFHYDDESDGVDGTGASYPFYPLPDEAITQPHWVEGGEPATVDLRQDQDRHLIVVDRDRRHLYELWNVWYDGAQGQWYAGSGAFFDLNTNARRPETWTSADAAGLAMLPGLVRWDEVFHADPTGTYAIPHAFRVTVRRTNGHVYPASHTAGSTPGALPMGARLRLKAGKDLSGFSPQIRRIFQAMKTYGLIVADNGTDMYITGTYDTRWNNDVLNPAFAQLTACDFEVIQLGWKPALSLRVTVNQPAFATGQALAPTLGLTNPGVAGTVDFYAGWFRPDGHSIVFFTGPGGFVAGDVGDVGSFRAAAASVPLGAPFDLTIPDLYSYPWTPADPRGTYVAFLVAVTSGALTDGALTGDEVVAVASAPFTVE